MKRITINHVVVTDGSSTAEILEATLEEPAPYTFHLQIEVGNDRCQSEEDLATILATAAHAIWRGRLINGGFDIMGMNSERCGSCILKPSPGTP